MSDERQTIEEFSNSLTGFDLLDIKKRFGATYTDLDPSMMTYSLVYIMRRREGVEPQDAYNEALGTSLGAIQTELFKPDAAVPEDLDDSPSGKG